MLHRLCFASLGLLLLAGCADSASDTMTSGPSQQHDPWAPLARYIDAREAEYEAIPAGRREELTA